jgi:predicted dehydrogenase
MTAFKKRYAACYQRARAWLDSFPVEDHVSISIDYASGGYGEKGEGFLLDFAIHGIDLISYLMGDVTRVACFAKQMDAYAVSLEFTNGAVGVMNLTRCRSFGVPTEEVELTVKGGNFMTIHNSSAWRVTEGEQPSEWREPPTFISAGDSGNDTGHLAEIIEFLSAIQEGRATRSQVYESYKSMVLYEAIRDAAATGKMVEVSYEAL